MRDRWREAGRHGWLSVRAEAARTDPEFERPLIAGEVGQATDGEADRRSRWVLVRPERRAQTEVMLGLALLLGACILGCFGTVMLGRANPHTSMSLFMPKLHEAPLNRPRVWSLMIMAGCSMAAVGITELRLPWGPLVTLGLFVAPVVLLRQLHNRRVTRRRLRTAAHS